MVLSSKTLFNFVKFLELLVLSQDNLATFYITNIMNFLFELEKRNIPNKKKTLIFSNSELSLFKMAHELKMYINMNQSLVLLKIIQLSIILTPFYICYSTSEWHMIQNRSICGSLLDENGIWKYQNCSFQSKVVKQILNCNRN